MTATTSSVLHVSKSKFLIFMEIGRLHRKPVKDKYEHFLSHRQWRTKTPMSYIHARIDKIDKFAEKYA